MASSEDQAAFDVASVVEAISTAVDVASVVDEISTAIAILHVNSDAVEVSNVVSTLVDTLSTPENENQPGVVGGGEEDVKMGQKTSKKEENLKSDVEFRDASAPPLEAEEASVVVPASDEAPVVVPDEPVPPREEAPSPPQERARASGSATETDVCPENDEFKTRLIQFNGTTRRIVMQSRNGPCPLLAAVNALVLLGKRSIRARTINGNAERVTRKDLTDMIGDLVSESPHDMSSQVDFEFALNDVLDLIPGLGRGLDVNVRFNSVEGFEYTKSMLLFELIKVNIYHTWKVDENSEYANAVGNLTYNQVVTQALENNVLADFLEETANQTTYAGLFGVRDAMNEGALAIVFRNNHFHTAHKRNGRVHLLCTDEGFLGSSAVWETLHSIEGDSDLLDSDFRPIAQQQTQNSTPTETGSNATTDSDYELAKKLQEEYNRSAAGRTQQPTPPSQGRSSQSSSAQQSRSQTPSHPPSSQLPPRTQQQKRDKGNCNLM